MTLRDSVSSPGQFFRGRIHPAEALQLKRAELLVSECFPSSCASCHIQFQRRCLTLSDAGCFDGNGESVFALSAFKMEISRAYGARHAFSFCGVWCIDLWMRRWRREYNNNS